MDAFTEVNGGSLLRKGSLIEYEEKIDRFKSGEISMVGGKWAVGTMINVGLANVRLKGTEYIFYKVRRDTP